jgi:uncharacterized protein (UPF0332 family)
MAKPGFLAKLAEKGKLGLVEPSEEIRSSYVQKSGSYMESSRILLEKGKLEEAVSMAYYSMYHMLTALLFRTGIKCENHSASIILLREVFGLDNSEISRVKRERIDKEYYVDFQVTTSEVEKIIEKTEWFNSGLSDFISRLNSGRIKLFRIKLESLLREE